MIIENLPSDRNAAKSALIEGQYFKYRYHKRG